MTAKIIHPLDLLRESGVLRDMDVQLVKSLIRTFRAQPTPKAQEILALACRASGDGHVCLNLGEIPHRSLAEALAELNACPALVGNGSGPQPFVLEKSRLYLRRFWNFEKQVAQRLQVLSHMTTGRNPDDFQKAIDEIHPLDPDQRAAIRKAIGQRLTLISGGPGTGKTTVAAHVLRIVGEAGPHRLRVLTAAPTGKAAARIDESLNASLPTTPSKRNPACTIERLLGYQRGSPYFRHNRQTPLPADIVLIDECSMIDLPKMAKLLDAIGDQTQLILLGDKDQLASVEPGSVMAEICQSRALQSNVVILTHSHRFQEGTPVAELSQAVNAGDASRAWNWATHGGETVVLHSSAGFNAQRCPESFKESIRRGYAAFMAAQTPKEAFAALATFRVLCALRSGPQGMESINRAIEDLLRPQRKGEFYDHRVVMVTQNEYDLHLFNGDVGVVFQDGDQPLAYFEAAPDEYRPIPCRLLPAHETAFAMTVHKAQGSGFGRVMVVLPDRENPILTRELIYTALTRTQSSVELWCEEKSFQAGVSSPTRRNMGLNDKLDAPQLDAADLV